MAQLLDVAATLGTNTTEELACVAILQGASAAAARRGESVPSSERSSFVRHVLLFSLANLGALVCNGVLMFLLPRWLSMENYGYYRLFILYGSFAGVLHFGLLDGALLRWAARSKRRMHTEMRHSLIFLLFQHGLLLIPAVAILIFWFRHQPWFFLASAVLVYALVWNAAVLGQFALQADKSFELLSAVTVIHPALLLATVAALNHWRHLTVPALLGAYLGAWLVGGIGVWIVLLVKHPGRMRSAGHIWQTGAYNIRVGWSVLLAGLLTNLALSLDRIAVSFTFGIRDFAIYSLAATALAVVNTIILSTSRVVFPYLSDGSDANLRIRAYAWGEASVMALWALSLAAYFPFRLLIGRLLPAYQLSLPIVRPLMIATGLTAAIYILHGNYFRSSLRQGRLLFGASMGLLAAGLFLAFARWSGNLVNMAWAMLAAITLWWAADELLLCEVTDRTPVEVGKTLLFVLACASSFLLCVSISGNCLGFFVYACVAAMLTALAHGRTLLSLPRLNLLAFTSRSFVPEWNKTKEPGVLS